MTPEGEVKKEIDREIKEMKDDGVPLYSHRPVQNGMGAPTLDYIGCCKGNYFAIEAKAPDKEPTLRQEDTMKKIREAGGETFVINDNISLAHFVKWARSC